AGDSRSGAGVGAGIGAARDDDLQLEEHWRAVLRDHAVAAGDAGESLKFDAIDNQRMYGYCSVLSSWRQRGGDAGSRSGSRFHFDSPTRTGFAERVGSPALARHSTVGIGLVGLSGRPAHT